MNYEVALVVQRFKALGRKQGFLTCQQVNDALPSELVDPENIERIADEIMRAGVRVVEHPPDES